MKINNKTELTSIGYSDPRLLVDNQSFLPSDKLPDGTIAADPVIGWGSNPNRSPDERLTAHRFLCQWPEGQQLKPGFAGRPRLFDEHSKSISTRIPKSVFNKIPLPRSKWVRDVILEKFL